MVLILPFPEDNDTFYVLIIRYDEGVFNLLHGCAVQLYI